MRYAILSDIHGNLQALDAVLADASVMGAECILCLGDVVGYGPDPKGCLKRIRESTQHILMGNHDAVIAGFMSADLFNPAAKAAIEWTEKQLNAGEIEFLRSLPLEIHAQGLLCSHGEFVMPGRFGYIFDPQTALASMAMTDEPLLFVGHSHMPLYYIYYPGNQLLPEQRAAESFTVEPHERYLINVGSVGQPRDGSTKACYCLYDSEFGRVDFRHVAFDFKTFLQGVRRYGLPESAPIFSAAAGDPDSLLQEDFEPIPAEVSEILVKRKVKQLQFRADRRLLYAMTFLITLLLLSLFLLLQLAPSSSLRPSGEEEFKAERPPVSAAAELNTPRPPVRSELTVRNDATSPPEAYAKPSAVEPRPLADTQTIPLPLVQPDDLTDTQIPPSPANLLSQDIPKISEPLPPSAEKPEVKPLGGERLSFDGMTRISSARIPLESPFALGLGLRRKSVSYDITPRRISNGKVCADSPLQGWTLYTQGDLSVVSGETGLNFQAEKTAHAVLLSDPIECDWTKPNFYQIHLAAAFPENRDAGSAFKRACAVSPEGGIWALNERPERITPSVQSLSIPKGVLPPEAANWKLHLLIEWKGPGRMTLTKVTFGEI